MKNAYVVAILISAVLCGTACAEAEGDEGGRSSQITSQPVVIFAWNDLGMHCVNPTYDTAVILPPYNNLMAVAVQRGAKPVILSKNITISYSIEGNTRSYTKGSYGQFWDNSQALFGVSPAKDVGLKGKGLKGTMDPLGGGLYKAEGIPVTPISDNKVWEPFQVALISVTDSAGRTLAQTRATVPVSDEINCAKCHGDKPFANILAKHDAYQGTTLKASTPVLCASCHASPALGAPVVKGIAYLSAAIHGFHADKSSPTGEQISCEDCHPGAKTKCSRSVAHTSADGNCVSCHGGMANVASTISEGGRVPWVSEPACSGCHVSANKPTLTKISTTVDSGIPQVATGTSLYRNAAGHGGLPCAACHGSPHAMVPSTQVKDNYQSVSYQGAPASIGSCGVCHPQSKGRGLREFAGQHGSVGAETPSACAVCHTSIPSMDTTKWPHAFMWRTR